MRKQLQIPVLLSCLVLGAGAVSAQGSSATEPAQHTMVKKGVFTLKEGQSVDVTDRGILLNLRKVTGDEGAPVRSVAISVNGGLRTSQIGGRMDLKTWRSVRDVVKDISSCFLDVVSASKPRGAAASATFRLQCE